MSEHGKKILIVAATVLIILLVLWGNTCYRQIRYFKKAESIRAQGDLLGAIVYYEAAVRMYTPGSSHVEQALDILWELGIQFEKNKQIEEALIAFRSIKTSLYAIRSFYEPYKALRSDAEKRIKSLLLRREPASASAPSSSS